MQNGEIDFAMQDFFKQMYKAHDLVKEIKDMIDNLYQSAAYISPKVSDVPKAPLNPQRLENSIVKMADLREQGEKLIAKRAAFDLFVCSQLSFDERSVLKLRCDDELSWKEIADSMKKGITTVKTIYKNVETKAGKFDFSCTKPTEKVG